MARKLLQYITEVELELLRGLVRDDDDLHTRVMIGKLMAAADNLLKHQTGLIQIGSGCPTQVSHTTLAKVASEYSDLKDQTMRKIYEARKGRPAA